LLSPDAHIHSSLPPRIQAVQTGARSLEDVDSIVTQLRSQPSVAGVLLVSGEGPSKLRSADAITHLASKRTRQNHGDDFALLAAENPNIFPLEGQGDGLRSLREKVDAGVDAVVTQPPLCRQQCDAWCEEISKLRLKVPLMVGAACLTSERSARFWLRMCNVEEEFNSEPELLNSVPEQSASEFARVMSGLQSIASAEWRAKSLPNAIGVHIMPVSSFAYKKVLWKWVPMLRR